MTKNTIESRLQELGCELPDAPPPAGSYVPWRIAGNLVFISGQVPFRDGKLPYRGVVGKDLTIEQGYDAAKLCGLNLITQLKEACRGDLDKVRGCVRLGGFVRAGGDFSAHPQVINGASDLMVEIWGEAGRHSRFAVGAASLPLGVAVEVEAVFELMA